MMKTLLFYLISAAALISAGMVVSVQNLFRGAFALIGMLLSVAGLYLLMDAQFLSAAQVTVYIGGIVVLIVYVVLLLGGGVRSSEARSVRWRNAAAAVLAAVLFVALAAVFANPDFQPAASAKPRSATVEEIGHALLSPGANGFVLPFEIISILLVAAIVGAVSVARARDDDV
jgi:NADH-quinone oxidoreductase subunit J